jgi:hypothetical protein
MTPTLPSAFIEQLRARAQYRIDHYGLAPEEAERRRSLAEPAIFAAGGRLSCPDCVVRGSRAWLAPWRFDPAQLWCSNCGFLVPLPAQ